MDENQLIPQKGAVLEPDVNWVQTKTTDPNFYKTIQFRAKVDGEVFCQGDMVDGITSYFVIPVSANDSYSKRSVVVESRISNEYYGESSNFTWTQWETVYSGIQDCLSEGEDIHYPDFSSYRIKMEADGISVMLVPLDTSTSEAFLRMLYDDGTFSLEFRYLSGGKAAYADSNDEILRKIPMNGEYLTQKKTGLFFNEWGVYLFTDEDNSSGGYSMIGYVTDEDTDNFSSVLPLTKGDVTKVNFSLEF